MGYPYRNYLCLEYVPFVRRATTTDVFEDVRVKPLSLEENTNYRYVDGNKIMDILKCPICLSPLVNPKVTAEKRKIVALSQFDF